MNDRNANVVSPDTMNTDYCEGCQYELKENENQYCEKCASDLEEMITDQWRAWQRAKRERIGRDFEREERWGRHDLQNHIRFGGTLGDYL